MQVLAVIDSLGRRFMATLEYTLSVSIMIYLSVRTILLDRAQSFRTVMGVVSMQIYFTGWQAMPLITLLSLASGTIVILQSAVQLNLVGGGEMIGNLLVVILVREVGPLMTAFVVIARSGTAVASEIGTMKVNKEIDALEVMGIHPLSYVVFPRLAGGIISVLCLAFYFNLIALLGGFIVTRFIQNEMPVSFYIDSLVQALAIEDVWLFLIKNSFSGAIIFVICCYQGLLVKQSPHEVPQVTTKAVVNSMIYVVLFNLSVTAIYYLNQLMKSGVI